MVFQLTLLIITLPNFLTKNNKNAKPLILQKLPNLDCYLLDYRCRLMSNQIKKEINSFFQKLNINVKLILIDETFNIDRVFTHKDKQHALCRSNVVYQIN